jgi:hypothetical protein
MRGFTIILALCLSIATPNLRSQTLWSGRINSYTAVTSFQERSCGTTLTIEPALSMAAGTRVLIVQMQGASFVPDDDDAVDGRPVMAEAGRFVTATVESVRGTTVTLRERIAVPFDVSGGRVQLVTIASADDARIVGAVTPMPWDGRIGGIVAIEVSGTLTLADHVDVSGMGFRGGTLTWGTVACHSQQITAPEGSTTASLKGEGAAIVQRDAAAGVGRAANGAGGGASTNTGGGGGGGAVNGGRGGDQWSGCGAMALRGGRGGAGMVDRSMPRLIMGGGGGAGHQNNGMGTAGANGGGGVYLVCGVLTSTGGEIRAGGASVSVPSGIDGAGGGGGAGSVVLLAGTVARDVTVDIRGGNGGNVNASDRHGPGGGGGGGVLYVPTPTQPASLRVVGNGGVAGGVSSVPVTDDRSHGARNGEAGIVITGASLDAGASAPPGVEALRDTVLCAGEELALTAIARGGAGPLRYRWTNATNQVLSADADVRTVITSSTRLTVTVTDSLGCAVQTSMNVTVLGRARMQMNGIDLGTLTKGPVQLDTFVTVRNLEARPITITRITFSTADVRVIRPPLPLTIPAGRTVRVDVRIDSRMSVGDVTMEAHVSACDTVVEAPIRWRILEPSATVADLSVDAGEVCTGHRLDTTLVLTAGTGSDVRITDIRANGTLDVLAPLPLDVASGQTRSIPIRVAPTGGAQVLSVRVAVVYLATGTVDTIIAGVTMRSRVWTLTAPDVVDLGAIPFCSGIDASSADVEIIGQGASTWQVASVRTTPSLSTTISAGTSVVGTMRFRVTHTARVPGPFSDSVVVRVMPCDTTVTIVITGTVLPKPVLAADSVVDLGIVTWCARDAEATAEGTIVIASSDATVDHIIRDMLLTSDVRRTDAAAMDFRGAWTGTFAIAVADTGRIERRVIFVIGPCDTTISVVLRMRVIRTVVDLPRERTVIVYGSADTVATIIMRNDGAGELIIATAAAVQAPFFEIIATRPPLPAVLVPGEELSIDVRVRGDAPPRSGSVRVGSVVPCDTAWVVDIHAASGARAVVRLPHVQTRAGAAVRIPMTFVTRPPDSVIGRAYTARFRADRRHAVISDAPGRTVVADPDVLTVQIDGVWDGSDTIVLIPVDVLLGPERTTPLAWTDDGFAWSNAIVYTETIDGSITHDTTCADRFVRRLSAELPNVPGVRWDPDARTLHIGPGDASTLSLYDLRGALLRTLTIGTSGAVLDNVVTDGGLVFLRLECRGHISVRTLHP